MARPRRIVACATCGQRGPHQARGQCSRCYHNDPALVHRCAETLAAQLDPEPQWWAGFGEFLAARVAATRAVSMLYRLAAALADLPGAGPTAVLQAVRRPGPAVGELARALQTYFVGSRHALALDTSAQAAADRRARRIAEIPGQFRPLATAFDAHQLQSRERAGRAGTKPRSDRTLEINLAAVRDLARSLSTHRPAVTDWALVGIGDVEAFLAGIDNPGYRARQLHARPLAQHRTLAAGQPEEQDRRQAGLPGLPRHDPCARPGHRADPASDPARAAGHHDGPGVGRGRLRHPPWNRPALPRRHRRRRPPAQRANIRYHLT